MDSGLLDPGLIFSHQTLKREYHVVSGSKNVFLKMYIFFAMRQSLGEVDMCTGDIVQKYPYSHEVLLHNVKIGGWGTISARRL